MASMKIRWNSLLNITELGLDGVPPATLNLSDDVAFTLSILTAATRRDRKLLRCDENGALLVSEPWNGLVPVETDELLIGNGAADSFVASVANKGVLVATQLYMVEVRFVRVSGGSEEVIYIAPDQMFWYPGPVYSVEVDDVPEGGTLEVTVGITAFN